ncbi:MAG: GTPase Era [Candidatus Gottesmanbacteria bacterium GW2011_GWC2_39_8]|uniref:GTPase Era n=1 Tax=Candidatus Gottesmanbacteria bacterium GW2011_GWC2_39_8 TaxID=1618450 RepID=A0A0G0SFD6_9BACT|nr:MAG: GTPase Era [Candidatus Gottesmanbacteria bacterium GW2011_GWC2_39_8]
MKSGYAVIIGRPNTGKSTMLNNLLGQKVSITSPKPQTTRFPLQAVYEDERGQIIFVDTPGMIGKIEDSLSQRINPKTEQALSEGLNVIVYVVDHTRDRDQEDNKALGLVRKFDKPKILVINKIDIKEPSYRAHYKFMEEEFDKTVEVSALTKANLNYLLDTIFEYLPEGKKIVDASLYPTKALNQNSKSFLAEIIREKAFLFLRKEVPYTISTVVDEVAERESGMLFIKARIITSADRYKSMLIGHKGSMIKEIGQAARKELQTATDKKVYLDLTVETNTHWMDLME